MAAVRQDEYKMDDERLNEESWLQPGAYAGPDAPAGGSGPGYSVPALSKSLHFPSLSSPGTHSPNACFFEWTAAADSSLAGDLILRDAEIRRNVEQYSRSIRDAVPDPGLRTFFDQQNMRAAIACRGNASDAVGALRRLRIEANWFDYPAAQPPTLHETEAALSRARTAGTFVTSEGARSLLDDLSQAAVQLRDRTIGTIRKAWLNAGRANKQGELIEIWRLRMRWIDDVSAPGGVEKDSNGTSPANADTDGSKRNDTKEKSKKTWVEFQLVDPAGKPVPHQKYVVTLPSGSRETGSLDSQGMVRFDGIDPGQCEISFPEIDGREWRPL